MSVSLFGFETNKQNRFLEKLHDELHQEVPGNSFEDNLLRSKLRLQKMMKFCRENYDQETERQTPDAEEANGRKAGLSKHLQNFDKIRQQMKQRIINVPQQDGNMNVIKENDDEKEEVEEEEGEGSIGFSQKKADSLNRSLKPSSLNARSKQNKNRDSIAINNSNKRKFKNQALDSIRHRNSEFIRESDVRRNQKTGPGLSKFASKQSQLNKMNSFGYDAELNLDSNFKTKQRDSIDVTYMKQTINDIKRPSTLAEIRNSMFQFKNELVLSKNTDIFMDNEDINDVYSDLSGNEFDAEEDQAEVESTLFETQCLQLQYLQHHNRFISCQSTTPFNIHAVHQDKVNYQEDEEDLPETKLSKRTVYFQELSPELTVNNFAYRGKILENNLRSEDAGSKDIIVCLDSKDQFDREFGETQEGAITHHSIKIKDIDGVNPSQMDRVRKGVDLIGSGLSKKLEEVPRYSISLAGHQVSSHVINPKFFAKHLSSERLVSLAESVENSESVLATSHSENTCLNLELGRLNHPIRINSNFKVMFNDVDGMQVDGILGQGFTDEELKKFIPKRENYFVECINRDPNDKSLYKKFLLDLMKSKGECISMDILDQSFESMINKKEAVSKIVRLKNEFFLKEIIKATRPSLIKVSFIRKYNSLQMVKKISTCIFFYSTPHEESEASKNEIGQILKAQYLRNSNLHIFGAGLQQQLPCIKSEFYTSQPIFNINLDYDILIGFDPSKQHFFFYSDSNLSTKKGKHLEFECYSGVSDESADNFDFTDLFKPISNLASLNHPSEGPWFVLPAEKQLQLQSGTLLKSGCDIFRAWNKKIKFCLKAN